MTNLDTNRCKPLRRSFYLRDPQSVGRDLIGHGIAKRIEGVWVGGIIVETEAYLASEDPASHSRSGMTRRCRSMFEDGGTLYVYSIHAKYCMNVVTQTRGIGSAVLIRAIEPVWGIETMKLNRGHDDLRKLARGPAMLCQALGIKLQDDGRDLVGADDFLIFKTNVASQRLVKDGPRIGITHGVDLPLRFFEQGNRYVSGPARLHLS